MVPTNTKNSEANMVSRWMDDGTKPGKSLGGVPCSYPGTWVAT